VQGTGPLRFAVYLHEYDSQLPLPVAVRGSNLSFYQGGAGEVSNAHAVHRVRLTPDGTRGRDETFLNREYE